ncbi:hypothetical protein L3Y34_003035 [Caenorhabditis briggsae]|uniref:Uncharacterized protein n=1 Tax=Caenorhabditis briggsae TaxID=6238 RepID=A0AAE9A9F9_CAEBR|nr:hypothetical protein L3Y34_003035 [Caenorhabditis briggsae]
MSLVIRKSESFELKRSIYKISLSTNSKHAKRKLTE